MLDPSSPVPLYRQLADLLARRIALGEYPPGSRIPSEPELAKRFAIGRPTVRQGLDLLVRQSQLERRRGTGTFVVERRHEVDLFSLGGTISAFRSSGIPVESEWLHPPLLVRVPEDASSPMAGRRVFRVERRSTLGAHPVLLETIDLCANLFRALDRLDLGQRSISELVRDEYHQRPIRGRQLFRVTQVDEHTAALLRVPRGTPALTVHRTLDFPTTAGAVYAELHCLTEQVVLAQTLGEEIS